MLDRKDRTADNTQAAIAAIEQRDVGFLDAIRKGFGINSKAMVHRNDLDLARRVVSNRMVGAVMALVHLLGIAAKCERQHLVAEADAEDRNVGLDQFLDGRNRIFAGRRRVAWSIGEEDAIRLIGQNVFGGGGSRENGDFCAKTGDEPQDIALDAVIDGDNVEFRRRLLVKAFVPNPWLFGPDGTLPRCDVFGEIEIKQAMPRCGAFFSAGISNLPSGSWAITAFGMPFSRMRTVRARVSTPAERNNAARFQPMIQMVGSAIARRRGNVGLEDCANRAGTIGRGQVLDVFLVGADIADMRKGEGNDLAGIGRIGENFLVAGKRGVEADFRFADARRAKALAFDDGAISQNQQCRWLEFSPARGLWTYCTGVCRCVGGHAALLNVGLRRCFMPALKNAVQHSI